MRVLRAIVTSCSYRRRKAAALAERDAGVTRRASVSIDQAQVSAAGNESVTPTLRHRAAKRPSGRRGCCGRRAGRRLIRWVARREGRLTRGGELKIYGNFDDNGEREAYLTIESRLADPMTHKLERFIS